MKQWFGSNYSVLLLPEYSSEVWSSIKVTYLIGCFPSSQWILPRLRSILLSNFNRLWAQRTLRLQMRALSSHFTASVLIMTAGQFDSEFLVDKLTDLNYSLWSWRMKMLLTEKELMFWQQMLQQHRGQPMRRRLRKHLQLSVCWLMTVRLIWFDISWLQRRFGTLWRTSFRARLLLQNLFWDRSSTRRKWLRYWRSHPHQLFEGHFDSVEWRWCANHWQVVHHGAAWQPTGQLHGFGSGTGVTASWAETDFCAAASVAWGGLVKGGYWWDWIYQGTVQGFC